MKVKVILNPYANRWRAKRRLPEIEAALALAGLEYDLVMTTYPGQGKLEAARSVGGEYQAVVAAGGDSTVSEVVNGLIEAAGDGPTWPLGVLPVGTGNDFNDMNGLPRDLRLSAQIIAIGETRQIDAGRLSRPQDQVDDHYFGNNCALAMEPMVTIENIRIKRLPGNARYILALARALRKLKAWQMRIRWDDGEFEGPTFLLSICNSPRTGGLFYMAPDALTDDGLFDFVILPEVSRLRVLQLLPRLFSGAHIQHPAVMSGRTTRLEITSAPGTPIHADGEVLTESSESMIYDILPGKITLLATNQ